MMAEAGAAEAGRTTKSLPVLALAAGALAWATLVVGSTARASSPYGSSMAVGTTIGSGFAFLCAWELMALAMMLPSSVVFLGLVRSVTAGTPRARLRRGSVGVGYGLAWAEVGCATILLSELLYRAGGLDGWLEDHASLLAGALLVLAGGFQLMPLKQRCLAVCAHPQSFLMRHYRRSLAGSFMLGLRFGLVCVGCCWALMVLMVLLGGSSLLLMALLTAIMFAERAMGWDRRFVKAVGIAGILLGVLVASSPTVLPVLTQNAAGWVEMAATGTPTGGSMAWCHG